MKNNNVYSLTGSLWRIWDLHVHSPASGFGSEDEYPSFIKNLKNSNTEVIGINDYATIDGYSKILKLGGVEGKVIFPVLELRMTNKISHKSGGVTEGGVSINFHVIFDNKLTVRQIQTEINSLECFYEGGTKTKLGHVENDKLKELSFDYFQTIESLEKSETVKDRFLIWVPYDEYGGIDNIDPVNDSFFKLGIINKADILGSSNKKQIDFFLGKKCLKDVGKNIPCIKGSDSHELNYPFGKLKNEKSNPINKYCWIKADKTFNGLKQIKFEPHERVKIQEISPSLDYDKPYFSKINITENEIIFNEENEPYFIKNENGIPLNQNLIAIIGGRGEGKSMLTDYIATSFIDQENPREEPFKKEGNINIEYFKTNQSNDEFLEFELSDEKHAVEFIYINQGKLKTIVEKKDKKESLANAIRRLAKLNEPEFKAELNENLLESINEYHKLNEYLSEKDDNGNLINSVEYLESKENSINEFISNITTKENKDKLTRYSENINRINNLKQKKEQLTNLLKELKEEIKNINERIEQLNEGTEKIPQIEENSFQIHFNAINNWIKELDSEIQKLEESIESVKDEFKDYKGDLTTLLNDIDKFQNSLFKIRKRLEKTKSIEIKRNKLYNKIFIGSDEADSLIEQAKSDYHRQKRQLENDWKNFATIDERNDLNFQQKRLMNKLLNDLTIDVIIDFDVDKFYDTINPYINGSYWRVKSNRKAQKKWFEIDDFESFFSFMKNRYIKSYNDPSFYQDDFKKIFFDEKFRNNFIKVNPILKYQNKDLNKLSVGQKGTVYLKMMLATEAFAKPIIFDQPEDDLDNEFIMNDLIHLFKNLKNYRQVIIVTHNANLVVNSDAEQVIIAKNDNGGLKYKSGSLENEDINSLICKILEGGKLAFEKRRNKYQYK